MRNTDEESATSFEERRSQLAKQLLKAKTRVLRRVSAIEKDLDRIEGARRLASNAAWLLPMAAKAAKGSTFIAGFDWSSGEPVEVRIEIDPAQAPRGQIDAVFHHAKRLGASEPKTTTRRAEALRSVQKFDELLALVRVAESHTRLEEIALEARLHCGRDWPRQNAASPPGSKVIRALPPHRTFASLNGSLIFVGRGAAQNDALTFEIARPCHLFLHARGATGAHVIVPLGKGRSCPAEVLIDAALLAAHFSNARHESVVEITAAPRKWVRKRRGAPPGAVVIEREKVVTLRMDAERLNALLAREVFHLP